jgi:hypothetical protein
MAQQTVTPTRPSVPRQRGPEETAPSGWVGWIVFAAVLMLITGAFQAIQGLVAIFKDTYYVVASSGLVVNVDYTAWGWTHLAFGALLILTGLGLFTGSMWARVLGVAVAALSMIVNFAFMAAFPVWSIVVIALDVFIILALTLHGSEMKRA